MGRPYGPQHDRRITALTDADLEFIYNAVMAGWTTPEIAKEVEGPWGGVYLVARDARRELRESGYIIPTRRAA